MLLNNNDNNNTENNKYLYDPWYMQGSAVPYISAKLVFAIPLLDRLLFLSTHIETEALGEVKFPVITAGHKSWTQVRMSRPRSIQKLPLCMASRNNGVLLHQTSSDLMSFYGVPGLDARMQHEYDL